MVLRRSAGSCPQCTLGEGGDCTFRFIISDMNTRCMSFVDHISLPVSMVCILCLCPQGWSKGFVFINGRNLGRHWSIGPQQTLYIPGPWLHRGDNQVPLSFAHGFTVLPFKSLFHILFVSTFFFWTENYNILITQNVGHISLNIQAVQKVEIGGIVSCDNVPLP